jgi:hypothetical protein
VSTLQAEIDERSQEIQTDGYSMSINEAVAMYEARDLDVHPEFQRIFRWSIEQQSKLVESIFLGIPIPPIFVAQRDDGVWDVIDGVQRLSTILRFMGALKDDNGGRDLPDPLVAGEYLPSLAGAYYSADAAGRELSTGQFELDDVQRRVFKRSRLDFQIVQKESDEQAKYDLFQRLNSGTRLSEQESRKCLAVMLDPTFSKWIDSLAADDHFTNVMNISDRQQDEAYDAESVLRYLAIAKASNDDLQRMGDVGEFLTKRMRAFIADPQFNRSEEEQRFRQVFSALDEALGPDAFRRHDPTRNRYSGRFSVSAFEVIATGLARNWERWSILDSEERTAQIRALVPTVWSDETFAQRAGGGKAAERRIHYMAAIGDRIFSGE